MEVETVPIPLQTVPVVSISYDPAKAERRLFLRLQFDSGGPFSVVYLSYTCFHVGRFDHLLSIVDHLLSFVDPAASLTFLLDVHEEDVVMIPTSLFTCQAAFGRRCTGAQGWRPVHMKLIYLSMKSFGENLFALSANELFSV
jgi:hypothetical protein